MNLNLLAAGVAEGMIAAADALRVAVHTLENGARVVDCGVKTRGGLEAGRLLAEVCLAGLGQVKFIPSVKELWTGNSVMVTTDHPVAACMASQYAGWEVSVGKFFAMGSGPMRALSAREELFSKIGNGERSEVAVGVLESGKLPGADVADMIAEKCGIAANRVILLVAPTRSQAGTIQVVARSVETSLHKLYSLGFDLARVESGIGTAPLPPVAANDLAGIGRTNDAILYGGDVTLFVRGDDASLQQIGPKTPSSASADHGQTFAQIFQRYDNDFYKIDPHLFSPAVVTFSNLDTGNTFRFGHVTPRVIHESFGAA